MVRYDMTAIGLVDGSNIPGQSARCVLMADNEEQFGSFLRNIPNYETTGCHIKVHHKF